MVDNISSSCLERNHCLISAEIELTGKLHCQVVFNEANFETNDRPIYSSPLPTVSVTSISTTNFQPLLLHTSTFQPTEQLILPPHHLKDFCFYVFDVLFSDSLRNLSANASSSIGHSLTCLILTNFTVSVPLKQFHRFLLCFS